MMSLFLLVSIAFFQNQYRKDYFIFQNGFWCFDQIRRQWVVGGRVSQQFNWHDAPLGGICLRQQSILKGTTSKTLKDLKTKGVSR